MFYLSGCCEQCEATIRAEQMAEMFADAEHMARHISGCCAAHDRELETFLLGLHKPGVSAETLAHEAKVEMFHWISRKV